MIDNLDLLLKQLNKCIKNENNITVFVDTEQLKFKLNILPIEIIYDDNGLNIIDGNGCNFWLTNPNNFELVVTKEYGDEFYAFRDYENKKYYGICF